MVTRITLALYLQLSALLSKIKKVYLKKIYIIFRSLEFIKIQGVNFKKGDFLFKAQIPIGRSIYIKKLLNLMVE